MIQVPEALHFLTSMNLPERALPNSGIHTNDQRYFTNVFHTLFFLRYPRIERKLTLN